MDWIKQFKQEQLNIPAKDWVYDYENIQDLGQLMNSSLLAQWEENEIINHFIYFNKEKIDAFDNFIEYLHKNNQLTLHRVIEYFKNENKIYAYNYELERDLMEDLEENFSSTIDNIIGVFRWAILTEDYEYAQMFIPLINQIDEGIMQRYHDYVH